MLGHSERAGRWRAGLQTRAVSVLGSCTLDLRRAEIDGAELVVDGACILGNLEVVVPEGVEVELTGIPILGSKELHVADVAPPPGSPRVRVRAVCILGSVLVRSSPPAAQADPAGAFERSRMSLEHGMSAVERAVDWRVLRHQRMEGRRRRRHGRSGDDRGGWPA